MTEATPDPQPAQAVGFLDLLDILGYGPGERVSLSARTPHEEMTTCTVDYADVGDIELPAGACVWFNVCPTSHPIGRGRGDSDEITRLPALWCDLDIKAGACRDMAHAIELIRRLAEVLGEMPSVIVYTGNGLHPYWPIEDGNDVDAGRALLARWHAAVRAEAAEIGAGVDPVFDAARMLRVPGTFNCKDPNNRRPVTGIPGQGAPLTLAQVAERFDERSIEPYAEQISDAEILSHPSGWPYAAHTCNYSRNMINGWKNDTPHARHPWFLGQSIRLECAHRNGCLTQTDYHAGRGALAARFLDLLRRPGDARNPHDREVEDVQREAVRRAAAKSDAAVRRELGTHEHTTAPAVDSLMPSALAAAPSEKWANCPLLPAEAGSAVAPAGRLAAALLNRSALRDLAPPEPLITDTLDRGTVAHLYGKWGSFKSFIALDWALCVATGKAWQNREVQQARTLYIAAEGAFGYRGRVNAWETGWQTAVADDMFDMLPLAVNVFLSDHVDELAELITAGAYGFVVIDTLARCMVGADENSARDAGVILDHLGRLRDATPDARGVILDVHHTGKDEKTSRGSSAFEAGADTVYFARRDPEEPLSPNFTLTRQKRKDGPEHDNLALYFDRIEGTDSGTIAAGRSTFPSFPADQANFDASANVLRLFNSHFFPTGCSRSQLVDVCKENDISKSVAYRAITDLLERGELINTGNGSRAYLTRGEL
jgi:AAA domain